MEEESESRVQELLANYPDIRSIVRGRDASLKIEFSDTRLLLFLMGQPGQKRQYLFISVFTPPVSKESKAKLLGYINVFPTPEKSQIEIEQKEENLDVPKIIEEGKRGLELFCSAREIGFENFPYSRITDSMQEEDLMILRLSEKHFTEESGIEFIDPKDYPDQMLRILKEAQISS